MCCSWRNLLHPEHLLNHLKLPFLSMIRIFADLHSLPSVCMATSTCSRIWVGGYTLRALLDVPHAVYADVWSQCCRIPWLMKTTIPPMLQYPVGDAAFQFTCSLISMFYAPELRARFHGILQLLACFLPGKPARTKQT